MPEFADALEIYRHQQIGGASGFGARPALLIVDFVNGFNDSDCFGGGNIATAIARTRDLLAHARRHKLPVAFTRVVYSEDGSDESLLCLKMPGLRALTEHAPQSQVVPELAPREGEYVVRKTQAS